VLDAVGVVLVSVLKEPLEVVCRRPYRVPIIVRGDRDVPHARAVYFLATVLVATGHGRGP
jgi:hypothetical protein